MHASFPLAFLIFFVFNFSFILLSNSHSHSSPFSLISFFIMRCKRRSIHDISASTLFPSVFSPSSSYFLPFHSSILHSLHVLFSFFLPIFLLLTLSTPYLTHNPPSASISLYPLGPTLIPIPSSSLSPCFTNYHFSLLSISFFPRRPSLSCSRRFNFLVILLLVLVGDVQTNPGPVFVFFFSKFLLSKHSFCLFHLYRP